MFLQAKFKIVHDSTIGEAKEEYLATIKKEIYNNDFIEANLLIERSYYQYLFFDGLIQNLRFYYFNKENNVGINSTIDVSNVMSSPLSIINGINKNIKLIEIKDNIEAFNNNEYNSFKALYIKKIEEIAFIEAFKKIKEKKNNYNNIDIEPINEFTRLDEKVLYEEIYLFRYSYNKESYLSIYSTLHKKFYEFNHPNSKLYYDYLAFHKKPIRGIPSKYYNLYYQKGFYVYLKVLNILKYTSDRDLFNKIQKGLDINSNMYNDYVDILIFYFKNVGALRYYNIADENINVRIMNSYLALKYNKDAGVFLYECSKLNLLDKNDANIRIKLLEISYHLKSDISKKYLYEYYSNYAFFNERKMVKYM